MCFPSAIATATATNAHCPTETPTEIHTQRAASRFKWKDPRNLGFSHGRRNKSHCPQGSCLSIERFLLSVPTCSICKARQSGAGKENWREPPSTFFNHKTQVRGQCNGGKKSFSFGNRCQNLTRSVFCFPSLPKRPNSQTLDHAAAWVVALGLFYFPSPPAKPPIPETSFIVGG